MLWQYVQIVKIVWYQATLGKCPIKEKAKKKARKKKSDKSKKK